MVVLSNSRPAWAGIGVDLWGAARATNNRETPMHLSLFTTFCSPSIFWFAHPTFFTRLRQCGLESSWVSRRSQTLVPFCRPTYFIQLTILPYLLNILVIFMLKTFKPLSSRCPLSCVIN